MGQMYYILLGDEDKDHIQGQRSDMMEYFGTLKKLRYSVYNRVYL